MEKIEYKGYTIKIIQDDDPISPREWDNLGKMICFHNNYNLGDKHNYNKDDFNSWQELAEQLKKDGAIIILPLGLYDHSGITMYIGNIHDHWDGGQVGFIVAFRDDILKNWNKKKISKKMIVDTEKILRNEVETYDQYLTGDVWGYDTGSDSCWGYYGQEDAISEAKSTIDYQIKEDNRKHQEQLKKYIQNHVSINYRFI